MFIDREYNSDGATSIDEDWTSDLVGSGVEVIIDGTERRLDTTGLVGGFDYPMRLELEARDAPCYVRQGDSAIVLGTTNSRLLANEWRNVTVSGVEEAYFAVQGVNTTPSGLLVAIRTDKI